MSNKGKGKRLNESQRTEIIAKLSKPNPPSKYALAREYNVTETAIRRTWDNRESIKKRSASMSEEARMHTFRTSMGRFSELEDLLYLWIDSMHQANSPPSPSSVIIKAKEIASCLSISEDSFKASWQWLKRFKERRGLQKVLQPSLALVPTNSQMGAAMLGPVGSISVDPCGGVEVDQEDLEVEKEEYYEGVEVHKEDQEMNKEEVEVEKKDNEAVDESMTTTRLKELPGGAEIEGHNNNEVNVPIHNEVSFNGFMQLHDVVFNMEEQLQCIGARAAAENAYDDIWNSFESFKRNLTQLQFKSILDTAKKRHEELWKKVAGLENENAMKEREIIELRNKHEKLEEALFNARDAIDKQQSQLIKFEKAFRQVKTFRDGLQRSDKELQVILDSVASELHGTGASENMEVMHCSSLSMWSLKDNDGCNVNIDN